jgi:hypothetical protein
VGQSKQKLEKLLLNIKFKKFYTLMKKISNYSDYEIIAAAKRRKLI